MRVRKLHVLWLCAMAIGLVLMAGCNANASPASNSTKSVTTPAVTEGLKEQGKLKVGLLSSAATPFVTSTEGTLVGMDVDLAYSIANDLGLEASFVTVSDVAEALNSCDLVMGVSPNEANGLTVVGDYAQTALALFHKGEAGVQPVDAIKGKSVAVQDGSPSQMSLRVTALGMKETPVTSINEAFDILDKGQVEYVACQSASGAYLSSWRDGITFAGCYSTPESRGIAMAAGEGSVQTAVREAYDRLMGNGVFDEIHRTWLGDFPKLTPESVIANLPSKEASGSAVPQNPASDEVLNTAMDGSTAGANAVTLSDANAGSRSQ